MCKSQITIRKFLKLLLEVIFYNVVIYCIFVLFSYEKFTWIHCIKAFNPIKDISTDFVSCFLIYYLLIPFVNAMIGAITRVQHRMLILLCLFFFVVLDVMPGVGVLHTWNYVGWFCILHIIASYIRLYENELTDKIKISQGWLALIMISFAIFSVVCQLLRREYGMTTQWGYRWVSDSNALLAIPTAITLFLWFKNLRIPQSKFINAVAASTFGVLLIRANSDAMRHWLWVDVCQNVKWYTSPYMPLYAIGCVLAIYAVCVLIDQVRIYVIEKPVLKSVDKVLTKYDIK